MQIVFYPAWIAQLVAHWLGTPKDNSLNPTWGVFMIKQEKTFWKDMEQSHLTLYDIMIIIQFPLKQINQRLLCQ